MALIVRNALGEHVELTETSFASGAEAAVHAVPKFPGVVVKLYHQKILDERACTLPAKIEAVCSDLKLAALKRHPGLAWPCFSVFDECGEWRGYAMRRVDGKRMNLLAHAMAYRENFPNLDRPALVSYLLNLLMTLRDIHAEGVMIGDYNLANFLCDPGSNKVYLIDCDSWQVDAGGRPFLSPVAAPDMIPPELQGRQLAQTRRTLGTEAFSLAILIFKVLMLGRHPYDVVGGAGPVENIRRGYFPYGQGGGGIPVGHWFNIWSHLPFKLKEQFIRTFKDGARDPSVRTSIPEWIESLTIYQRELDKGWHDAHIKPDTPKTNEYRGIQKQSQPIAC